MNVLECGAVLTQIIRGDNRKGGEEVIAYWFSLIGDLDFRDAFEAVMRHRRQSTQWLEPAHVRAGVDAIRRERWREFGGEGAVTRILAFRRFASDAEFRAAKFQLNQDVMAGRPVELPKELEA